ncbi:MAG: glycosyltransferase [Candidatus Levybacteria bacterium]|nr:glycosyltransferase [Candidatus Levybacteria bacterium]
MKNISIIVPVWNEEKNIRPLVEQINYALIGSVQKYEIVFVDDRSTDRTVAIIKELSKTYPIKLHTKKGKQGKAYSLLEGFGYAKYELLCMIDADLQYQPKYIPEMIAKINGGADIVIANRNKYEAGMLRRVMSKVYHHMFSKLLHGFSEDVQSGLKVFRKSLVNHFELNPSSWTFDLEFLLKARHAGYTVASVDVDFAKRHAGTSKIAVVRSSLEIGLSAVALKFKDNGIVPFSQKDTDNKGQGFHMRGNEYIHHTNLTIGESALTRMTTLQYAVLGGLITAIILGLVLNWHTTLVVFISVLTVVYFTDLLFNFFLIYRSYFKEAEINITARSINKIPESAWPTYTVLCPLYKEWEVLPQFVKAMSQLDYPKDKLQVMLLLESEDTESIDKIAMMNLPFYFDVVIVPESKPKTKPKACNYGLIKATGEYTVIFDAEDVPDPLQLKKAVLAFKKAKKNIICLQAKLNFYNPDQNLLTRMFTIEYSLWFNLVLSGLQSIHAPIPLGGTSNHFRTKDIIRLQKWDPFNVTEDADLGMRLTKIGYRTALINSTTMEEANSDTFNWVKQRSRWIKGYIQTYFVHMRNPQAFFTQKRPQDFFIFQLVIGGKILSMLINPIMWLMTIAYFAFTPWTGEFIKSLYLAPIFYMAVFSMFIGNFLYMYYYMLGAAKREQWGLVPFALLTPIYWLGMSIAAGLAIWEFVFKPHYWHKTQHGLHLDTVDNDPTGTGLVQGNKSQIAGAAA